MDCEMPVMDGYRATENIRAWEQQTGNSSSVIVALTAHVMKEYGDKSTAAGMDLHLPKPLEIDKLKQVLLQVNAS